MLRLVAEDDDTQLFPEFGMLVSQYLCLPEIERAQMSVDGRLKG